MATVIERAIQVGKWGLKKVVTRSGFDLEVRRQGDLSLGLWRKKISKNGGVTRRLVWIPGFGDSPLSWLPTAIALEKNLRIQAQIDEIVLLECPGFSGFLSEHPAFESLDLLFDKMNEVLVDLEPQVVVGHSLGGWIAGQFALRSAELVRHHRPLRAPEHVLLLCPAGVFESERAQKVWEKKFRRARQEGFKAFVKEAFGKEPIWFRVILPEFERFIRKPEIGSFMDSVEQRHLLTGIKPKKQSLGFPQRISLFFCEKDLLAPPTAIGSWTKVFENVSRLEVRIMPNVGHSPQIEKPRLFWKTIAPLLKTERVETQSTFQAP